MGVQVNKGRQEGPAVSMDNWNTCNFQLFAYSPDDAALNVKISGLGLARINNSCIFYEYIRAHTLIRSPQ